VKKSAPPFFKETPLNPQAPAILLVEKDEVTLEMYQRELSKSFTVFALTEIRGIPEILSGRKIQVMVIEPEIDTGRAWELIQSMPTMFPNRLIPVIVCSTRDALGEGPGRVVAKYLTKPVLPKTLREITLEVLRSKAIGGACA
jgi:DNA-binding response OmpR family regulator